MDFSQAQRAAHAEEFAATMTSRIVGWNRLSAAARAAEHAARLEEASNFQQGCVTHFQRSAMRLKKDKSIIPAHLADTFEACLHTLLNPGTTLNEYKTTLERMRSTFPSVLHGWINWWDRPKIAAMIFPACRSERDDDFRHQGEIPQTSNPIETQHSLLHHATGTGYDLIPGIEALVRHVKQLEAQYDSARSKYGDRDRSPAQ